MDKKEEDVKIPTKDEILATLEEGSVDEQHDEEAPKPSEAEVSASSYGWKSKDKWIEAGGDPEDWRPAKAFLERGEMIGKIRSLSKEAQETKFALQKIAEQNKKIYENGYKQALNDLKAERRTALEQGDLVKADELEDKIDAAKAEITKLSSQPAVPQAQQVDPAHVEWVQANPWYNDPVMQNFADGLAREFVRVNGGQVQPDDVRKYVSATVRKEFKHRFEPEQVKGAPNPDSSSTRTGGNKSGGLSSNLSKIEADMPDEHRQIMKTMLKMDPKFTKEEYLKMYVSGR